MEGKEVRFGTGNSALWAIATTAASNGSVNAMHDSFTPLGALALMLQMQVGEIIFGGVGSGFYGMLAFVLITIFIAGLMVGRTPEYLGKKIEAREVKLSVLAFLVMPLAVLVLTRYGGGHPRCRGLDPGFRAARLLRDPLCLLVGDREQRLGLRRLQRQHALPQHLPRPRHAGRPLRLHRADAGDRRLARRQENRRPHRPAPSRPTRRCSWCC